MAKVLSHDLSRTIAKGFVDSFKKIEGRIVPLAGDGGNIFFLDDEWIIVREFTGSSLCVFASSISKRHDG